MFCFMKEMSELCLEKRVKVLMTAVLSSGLSNH